MQDYRVLYRVLRRTPRPRGRDLGPRSIWVMSFLCLLNLLLTGVFSNELKPKAFDPVLAALAVLAR